jgi:rubredoxin
MFTICPECENDKLKVKAMPKRVYDPRTTRVTVEEDIPEVEYHCHQCGWTALVEDPADPPRMNEREEAPVGREAGIRREKGQ